MVTNMFSVVAKHLLSVVVREKTTVALDKSVYYQWSWSHITYASPF